MKLLIYGGTIEGRRLTEYLAGSNAEVHVCVATDYGKDLLGEAGNITVHTGRLDEEEMKNLLDEIRPDMVIDATHPYAVNVSRNIISSAKESGIRYIRIVRDEDEVGEDDDTVVAGDVNEAIAYLEDKEGKIFLTTGSNELEAFTGLTDFQNRLVIRVLSSPEVMKKCKELGFPGKYTIAAQGPFSEDINYAMFKEYSAKWLVTKNTGDAGGFAAKLNAARRAGMKTIVIGRPEEISENTMTLAEVIKALSDVRPARPRQVFLIGIGPGSRDLMTLEAVRAAQESDLIIGADRMIRDFKEGKDFLNAYRKDEIADHIDGHPEFRKIAVMLSGDIGFYSGAKGLIAMLRKNDIEVKCIPGISSPIYLMDRLGVSWDDAVFASIHGLDTDIAELIKNNNKVCAIVGKTDDVSRICSELVSCDLGDVRVSVGSNLSYPEEAIVQGSAAEFQEKEFPGLSVALFERE